MTLFERGDFTLASGAKATWKIECDALTQADWEGIAEMLVGYIAPFGLVVGVPRGGLPLERALAPYTTMGTTLVVDDVWTTGGSMNRYIMEVLKRHPGDVQRAVAFARGRLHPEVTALFAMPGCTPLANDRAHQLRKKADDDERRKTESEDDPGPAGDPREYRSPGSASNNEGC